MMNQLKAQTAGQNPTVTCNNSTTLQIQTHFSINDSKIQIFSCCFYCLAHNGDSHEQSK
jgi:hypothetical protein